VSEKEQDLNEQNQVDESLISDEEILEEAVSAVDAQDEEIEKLNDEIGQLKDQMLRVQADASNVRRRAEIDVQNAHKFGQEKLAKDLLQVADNLERGLANIDTADEAMKSVVEGIELTLKSLVDTLTKHHIVQIDPAGEPFDPNAHQAMAMVPNPEVEPNTVIEVMQKGYSLHGRVIRPAMVVVAKA